MSFATRITRSDRKSLSGKPLLLVQNLRDASGKLAWYFVYVPSAKLAAFKRELTSEKVDITAFGEILSSGYGETPPTHVTQRMREQYGFKE